MLRRGRVWYWKKMVNGRTRPVSLGTEDTELAKARRDKLERESTEMELEDLRGPRSRCPSLKEVLDQYRRLAA
jgi:hypothetical protein